MECNKRLLLLMGYVQRVLPDALIYVINCLLKVYHFGILQKLSSEYTYYLISSTCLFFNYVSMDFELYASQNLNQSKRISFYNIPENGQDVLYVKSQIVFISKCHCKSCNSKV